jgi:uncharacterized protein (TIGR03437 family)
MMRRCANFSTAHWWGRRFRLPDLCIILLAMPVLCFGQATITVYAGTGNPPINPGAIGDGGPARNAYLESPEALAVDAAGNLYIRERARIRKVTPAGIISTVAGTGANGFSGDGGPATSAQLGLSFQNEGITTDAAGNLYLADTINNRVRKVDTSGKISTVAGNGQLGLGAQGDGGPATSPPLCSPSGVAVDRAGNLYIGSRICGAIRKVDPSGIISTVGRNISSINHALTADGAGTIYAAANLVPSQIQKLNADGTLSTIAGTGVSGFSGDGGPATKAQFFEVGGLAADNAGNIFIADGGNGRLRRIDTAGVITTVAGSGTVGPGAGCQNLFTTGCPATNLKFSAAGVAVDAAGNVYAATIIGGLVLKISGIPAPAAPPAPPAATVTNTVSAAGQQNGPFAAESIVLATGTHLATGSATGDLDQPPTTLAGTTVNVTDSAGVTRPAALISVSATQVTYQIPPGTAPGTATVTITAGDGVSGTVQLQIAAVAPGIYTLNSSGLARGYAVRTSNGNTFIEDVFEIDATGAMIARSITVSNGDQVYLLVYGTGFRAAGGDVSATIGGITAPVLYAGPQGVQPGLDQFNILIPPELGTGTAQVVQIVLTAAGQTANTVNVTVR